MSKTQSITKSRVHSAWTPLNNEEANQKNGSSELTKIFEERRHLVGMWFDKWSDTQRKKILDDLLSKCKQRQIDFVGDIVNKKRPIQRDDFTRHLPRVISLYIFSYLDPRSLCRCAQVCWSWKYLVELDNIWMPKCVRVGWLLPFSPGPYEVGTWKRLYIENVSSLKIMRGEEPTSPIAELVKTSNVPGKKTPRPDSATKRKPWRGSDPVPQDTWRNNYLDNNPESDKVKKYREKGLYGTQLESISKNAKSKVQSGKHIMNSKQHSRSLTDLTNGTRITTHHTPGKRPEWAKPLRVTHTVDMGDPTSPIHQPVSKPTDESLSKTAPVKIKSKHRTPRDPPTSDLFPQRAWKIPDDEDSDLDT